MLLGLTWLLFPEIGNRSRGPCVNQGVGYAMFSTFLVSPVSSTQHLFQLNM